MATLLQSATRALDAHVKRPPVIAALDQLCFANKDLAARLGIRASLLSNYRAGRRPIPLSHEKKMIKLARNAHQASIKALARKPSDAIGYSVYAAAVDRCGELLTQVIDHE